MRGLRNSAELQGSGFRAPVLLKFGENTRSLSNAEATLLGPNYSSLRKLPLCDSRMPMACAQKWLARTAS